MDFLLECIGFPPRYPLEELARIIRAHGETVAWRGPSGEHLRYPLAPGLEVRLDREEGRDTTTLWPHFEASRRLRVAVNTVQSLPDSPFDALLTGVANPPLPDDPWGETDGLDYAVSTYLSDARRLPRRMPRGHVLAVQVAGFALDVSRVGPDEGISDPYLASDPLGAGLAPVSGPDRPGGCMELSLKIREVRHLENPLTGEELDVVVVEAPGRALELFLSRWQLATDGCDPPRPGWRIDGAFLFSGRVAGGLSASPVHSRWRT